MMNNIRVRNATLEDAVRILEIYAWYVENSAITFEYEVPSLEEFQARMRHTMEKYPYLVIERQETVSEDPESYSESGNGRKPEEQVWQVEGYAYAGAFVGRAAYDWSCEMTIYLDHDARKCGMGRKLYEAMESALKRMGILNLYACIGYPQEDDEYLTKNSAEFHHHLGYELVGTFHLCGYKFNRWYDMIWMEKIVGEHTVPEKNIVPYPDLPV